ncbi:monooxygenase [Chryseobacterium sp. T16E-39]|uniref:FAD-dependent monooxygenase n=1 Tax=Chryseobacterium sp. T16E-39 TaxID=2015076 RepID=UPI000B5B1877|nr:FAD-dependent monooxygenase [Chryseobacterium sp. T16E-39]ASK29414.1 monooxygenase [Chryseobacterium sp. T16E-39]
MNSISIIGAGIGGLTLGNVLKQHQVDFKIYESAPEIKPVGSGIMMAMNAMQVFDTLGLREKIENAGNKIRRISITDQSLRPISVTNGEAVEKKFNLSNVAIHRAELQKVLAEHLGFENIQLSHGLQKIEKKENYSLHFENGTELESEIVFGADGIKSKIRSQILKTGTVLNTGQVCWRGLVDYDLPEKYHHEALEIWGKGKRFGFVKMTATKVYWYAVINQKNFKPDINLLSAFGEFNSIVLDLIQATDPKDIILNDITYLSPIPKWYSDHLCLIGDAAHATTPNMGQGACQAIEDAYIIGKLLEKDRDYHTIFENFQKIRRKKVDYVVSTSHKVGKISMWEYGTEFRNFLFRLVPDRFNQKMIEKLIQLEM